MRLRLDPSSSRWDRATTDQYLAMIEMGKQLASLFDKGKRVVTVWGEARPHISVYVTLRDQADNSWQFTLFGNLPYRPGDNIRILFSRAPTYGDPKIASKWCDTLVKHLHAHHELVEVEVKPDDDYIESHRYKLRLPDVHGSPEVAGPLHAGSVRAARQ